MSGAVSPVSGTPYGLAAVCRVWRLPDPGFIAIRLRRPIRHPNGAGQWGQYLTMR